MKYIKKFEDTSETFKVGDYVKCIEEPGNYIFKIDGNDIKLNDAYIISELHDIGPKVKVSGIMRWYFPIYFEKISKEEYELITTTNKYNL